MATYHDSNRPTPVETTDGRKANSGDPATLATKVEAARDAAPDGARTIQIASVAWAAFEEKRDPAEVWVEVLADG